MLETGRFTLISVNLVYFSTMWILFSVKDVKHEKFKTFLHERSADGLHTILKDSGEHIFSEDAIAKRMHTFSSHFVPRNKATERTLFSTNI